jgi:hypothetical protein
MYTQSLGRDVEDLNLHVKYIDDSSPQICNLAFVPRESTLVDTVVRKVPNDQLEKFGVRARPGDQASDGITQEKKLDVRLVVPPPTRSPASQASLLPSFKPIFALWMR